MFSNDNKKREDINSPIIASLILIVLSVTLLNIKPTTTHKQYKAMFKNEVDMNEFYEKYEILDKDGQIFTIREKEVDDENKRQD